jgi:hypothetical protein
MEGQNLVELARAVGEAAAVGRVPMTLWSLARNRYRMHPLVYVPEESLKRVRIPYVSKGNMPLSAEPLRALYHFLWVLDHASPGIPTDVKLYMFNFAYADEAHARAQEAIYAVYACDMQELPRERATGLPQLRAENGYTMTCTYAGLLYGL